MSRVIPPTRWGVAPVVRPSACLPRGRGWPLSLGPLPASHEAEGVVERGIAKLWAFRLLLLLCPGGPGCKHLQHILEYRNPLILHLRQRGISFPGHVVRVWNEVAKGLCTYTYMYSGTPLLWIPWGPGEVSCIQWNPSIVDTLGAW